MLKSIALALNRLFKRDAATFGDFEIYLSWPYVFNFEFFLIYWYLSSHIFLSLSAEWYRSTKFLIIRLINDFGVI